MWLLISVSRMAAILTSLRAGFAQRLVNWGGLVAAVGIVWILIRQGRLAAEAEFARRRADARVHAHQMSKETRHEVQNIDRPDLEHRADRWMRD